MKRGNRGHVPTPKSCKVNKSTNSKQQAGGSRTHHPWATRSQSCPTHSSDYQYSPKYITCTYFILMIVLVSPE